MKRIVVSLIPILLSCASMNAYYTERGTCIPARARFIVTERPLFDDEGKTFPGNNQSARNMVFETFFKYKFDMMEMPDYDDQKKVFMTLHEHDSRGKSLLDLEMDLSAKLNVHYLIVPEGRNSYIDAGPILKRGSVTIYNTRTREEAAFALFDGVGEYEVAVWQAYEKMSVKLCEKLTSDPARCGNR